MEIVYLIRKVFMLGFRQFKKKSELLRKEGIKIKNNKIEDFNSVLYKF